MPLDCDCLFQFHKSEINKHTQVFFMRVLMRMKNIKRQKIEQTVEEIISVAVKGNDEIAAA